MSASIRSPRWWPGALVLLFLAAWLWRLSYLGRLAKSPFAGSLNADAKIYWDWSGHLLHDGMTGTNPFFFAPLYPYVLALLRGVFGDSVATVLSIQALWGAGAAVLLADAARRLTRPVIGCLIGLLVAGYERAVFFDGLVLTESLLFFLESLLFWRVAVTGWASQAPAQLVGMGLVVGLLAQGRATAAFLLVPCALCIRLAAGSWRRGGRSLLWVCATFLVTAVPAALHNWTVAHEWIPVSYNLGYNLYVGNNPQATGSFVVVTGHMEPIQAIGPRPADGGVAGDGRAYLRSVHGLDLSAAES